MTKGLAVSCFLGIGSNQSNPAERYLEAVAILETVKGITIRKKSSMYKSEPVGFSSEDWFINAVVAISTTLAPAELLRAVGAIETKMGRQRGHKQYASRIIDIDILLYDALITDDDFLCLPHPRMHERKFVLMPLCEIAPQTIHPLLRSSCVELLAQLDDKHCVEKI